MTLERKLPKDTNKLLTADNNNIDNFNLKLNKAALFNGDKFIFFKKADKGQVELNVQPDYSKIDIDAITKRYRKTITKLNLELKMIMLKPDWRLIIGLGNESVYETSITLHHIYGFPYIPGSAIKGVTRNYYINNFFEKIGLKDTKQVSVVEKILESFNIEKDKNSDYQIFKKRFTAKKTEPDKSLFDYFSGNQDKIINFQNIFGTSKRVGRVIFFDAFPLEPPHIESDIMNPHYGPYYSDSSGKIPPADYHNPVPIPFLTVRETPFEFIIGIKKKNNIIIQNGEFADKYPLKLAYENMQKALGKHGIGAKTAVGYGYMGEVSEKYRSEHMTENEKEEERRKKDIENEKKKRRRLIDQLSKINFDKNEHYPINDAIKYFKSNSEDAEYKAALFDVILDYDKMSVLNTRQNDEGIVNNLFELYKSVKENNDKSNNDINLLEEKVPKIIKKLGGKNLKKKWKSYNQSQNE